MKIISLCLILFLLLNSVPDLRRKQIYIWSVPVFILVGVIVNIYTEGNWISVAAGAGIGFIILCLAVLTKNAIGLGDGLIILTCGIYLGFVRNLLLLMGGFVLTSMFGVFLILIRKADKKTKLPFVPFLFLSYTFIYLWLGEIS